MKFGSNLYNIREVL